MFNLTDNELNLENCNENILVEHTKKEKLHTALPHLHRNYEIYYNIHGAKGYMINGVFYKCKENDLVVIPQFYTHKVLVNKGVEYERCIINIDEGVIKMLETVVGVSGELSWLTNEGAEAPKMVNLSPQQSKYYVALIEKYIKLESQKATMESFAVFISILAFLEKVFRQNGKTVYLEDDESVSYVDNVIKYIEFNFRDTNVSDVARKHNIDKDYLNRIFKQETDVSIKSYIIIRKIAEAKKYLYLGKTVKEACYLSGFKDYTNFARVFKKYEGYTPSKTQEFGSFTRGSKN